MARKKINDFIQESSPKVAVLMRRLHQILFDYPEVEMRRMFGCNGYFVTGNIFCILDPGEEALIVKLSDVLEFDEIKKQKNSKLFAPGGTAMKHWIYLPEKIANEEDRLDHYLSSAYESAKKLKPKKFKTRSRKIT